MFNTLLKGYSILYSMPIFRLIKQSFFSEGGSIEWTSYSSLTQSYKACLVNENVCCRLLMNGLIDRIEEGQTLIRVICDTKVIYWIQVLTKGDEPLPELPAIKIDCCHNV